MKCAPGHGCVAYLMILKDGVSVLVIASVHGVILVDARAVRLRHHLVVHCDVGLRNGRPIRLGCILSLLDE